jgi:hypothetical protein
MVAARKNERCALSGSFFRAFFFRAFFFRAFLLSRDRRERSVW